MATRIGMRGNGQWIVHIAGQNPGELGPFYFRDAAEKAKAAFDGGVSLADSQALGEEEDARRNRQVREQIAGRSPSGASARITGPSVEALREIVKAVESIDQPDMAMLAFVKELWSFRRSHPEYGDAGLVELTRALCAEISRRETE